MFLFEKKTLKSYWKVSMWVKDLQEEGFTAHQLESSRPSHLDAPQMSAFEVFPSGLFIAPISCLEDVAWQQTLWDRVWEAVSVLFQSSAPALLCAGGPKASP